MSIRSAIYDLLNDIEADMYPMVAPQETSDTYIVYTLRREPQRSQAGIWGEDIELTLNIYGSLDNCITMAASIYTALEGATGTYDSETLNNCIWTGEDGDYIAELDKYIISQTYTLNFI